MRKFLIKTFVKDYENVRSPKVRISYGKLAGVVGIITNTIICVMKIIIGFFSGSIAIIADGINNLADASSSIVTLLGFKMASKEEDAKHPYGHGRFEYLAALVVSAVIIIVGIQLLLSSIDKIRNPEPVEFSYIIVGILVVSILIKVWQALFNIKIGKTINSGALKATGTDSRNDVVATSAVLVSIFIGEFSGINVDGYMGVLVALFITYSGIQLVRETIDPLLGQPPSPELVKEIETRVESYQGVLGIHDLVIHDYGPGRVFASLHAEVDAKEDILISHDIIDNAEKEVSSDLNVELVIHMDPVKTDDPQIHEIREVLNREIKNFDYVEGLHDLRLVPGPTHTNVIFDLVLTPGNSDKEPELKKFFIKKLQEIDSNYYVYITFDIDFTL